MKILVIEDDPTVGQFVKRGLEQQRWGVDLVANGDEGEQAAMAGSYDMVILDMRLPGKPGLEVLNGLRAKGFERPILVLTAQDAIDAKVETLRAGADDYVTKPFAFEELLARVEALSRRPRVLASPSLKVADLELHLDTRFVFFFCVFFYQSSQIWDFTQLSPIVKQITAIVGSAAFAESPSSSTRRLDRRMANDGSASCRKCLLDARYNPRRAILLLSISSGSARKHECFWCSPSCLNFFFSMISFCSG